ncbi:TetR/AcrR family transcriptional regulator [Nonomuraea sediminis]|uniref:TetR/AcrR family transcriptional regulator n=1 Tax=Nonomuraea sediminis TaxID=2835864 RepID=UPI0027E08211|nr:helix-turn-helix domain-containing protein [Nonomuraea sediminis]
MRSDAARNRDAILRATERLLADHGAEHVSLDRVAAAAGVGKGTVFRRFGSRTGLFQELLTERAESLAAAIESADSHLGPGHPPASRLLGFLDELAGLAERNLALFAAHERACADDKYADPTYVRWHAHVTGLVAEARPDLDAGFVAHLLLGCFDADLVGRILADGGLPRLRSSIRGATAALLGPA